MLPGIVLLLGLASSPALAVPVPRSFMRSLARVAARPIRHEAREQVSTCMQGYLDHLGYLDPALRSERDPCQRRYRLLLQPAASSSPP
jgi:hypothetical protein